MSNSQNKDVMSQIRAMLETIQNDDPQQAKIVLNLLNEVVKEYNSGRPMNVERKLYDMIDSETFETRPK